MINVNNKIKNSKSEITAVEEDHVWTKVRL